MSHGHDHKEYKRVFGDVERGSRGLLVLCDGDAPKSGTEVHQQVRAVCLGRPLPACESCEHGNFTVKFQNNIGGQMVACPRWKSISDRIDKKIPQYEMVRREQCLLVSPYEYCSSCPNRNIQKTPRTEPGWWEEEKWKDR